jgi:hypothetical protein
MSNYHLSKFAQFILSINPFNKYSLTTSHLVDIKIFTIGIIVTQQIDDSS